MKFRTEITIPKVPFKLSQDEGVLMLGSCFTDNIGSRLETDGFRVIHNPMGPLYNPVSLRRFLERIEEKKLYTAGDLKTDKFGIYHCLEVASRYQSEEAGKLLDALNAELSRVIEFFATAKTVILTYGTSYVFEYKEDGRVVGNCHKLPVQDFRHRILTQAEVFDSVNTTIRGLKDSGKQIILTVSPVRHLFAGATANTISKGRLLEAVCEAQQKFEGVFEFPAYNLLLDDLRDYRFYASDLVHPSDSAVEYIHEKFADAFYGDETMKRAREFRKQYARRQHRPILESS